MTRFRPLPFALGACVIGSLCGPSAAAETRPPNIVFLFADDLGWGDAHCYGHPYSQTPNIDKLAADGTRFLQCYATGVTCCPSRTGFMTARFPATFAKYPATGGFGGRPTITELLKKHGYATGHFGKWHIGPENEPGTYGIDVINAEDGQARGRRDPTRGKDAHIYDQAIRFIEKHKGGPFYVNVWGHVPHHPVNPSETLLDAFGPLTVDESKFPPEMRGKFTVCKKRGGDVSEHMRAYLAELKALDSAIGRLLRRLDELGLREDTIVVFSSDQGPESIRDVVEEGEVTALRLNAMGFAGPFRGGKHNRYEGGIRIPFIVRWPGKVPAGRVEGEAVLSGADWLPTLCGIAGVKIDAADFDGEDASKAWLGAGFARTKPLMWRTRAPRSPGAIREGRWKLHRPNRRRGHPELYDVVADPGERHDLAEEHPDIVKRLSARLDQWQATLPKGPDETDDDDK